MTPPAIAPAWFEDFDAAKLLGVVLPVALPWDPEDGEPPSNETEGEGPEALGDPPVPVGVGVMEASSSGDVGDDVLEVPVYSRGIGSCIAPMTNNLTTY